MTKYRLKDNFTYRVVRQFFKGTEVFRSRKTSTFYLIDDATSLRIGVPYDLVESYDE